MSHDGALGAGAYFAKYASYPLQISGKYARHPDINGHIRLIIAQVHVGRSCFGKVNKAPITSVDADVKQVQPHDYYDTRHQPDSGKGVTTWEWTEEWETLCIRGEQRQAFPMYVMTLKV